MDGHLNKREYTVETIPLAMGVALVSQHHYSRGASNTAVYRHGLFRIDAPLECLGVALWLPPTRPAALSVSPDWKRVLSLTRLVIVPGMPTNAASFLLGKSMGLIRKEGRFQTLLTYADEGQGHTGAIYRATNWQYLGAMKGHPVWLNPDGRQMATKATTNRTYAEMQALGYERGPATRKHKFVMHLR